MDLEGEELKSYDAKLASAEMDEEMMVRQGIHEPDFR